ncbi:hypothetical protein ACHAWF_017253 [Thalassiosira exigua]
MISAKKFIGAAVWFRCLVAQTGPPFASSFQPIATARRSRGGAARATELGVVPHVPESLSIVASSVPSSTSVVLSSEGESWRQYVPLAVSVGVIIDILLGSPVANLALGPMRRASEKGAAGDSAQDNGGGGSPGALGGGSLFSAFGGNFDAGGGNAGAGRGKERVDSGAIAQAALDKAYNTLELKRFLEENKSDEQRYEDVRKKIDQQMEDLNDDL